MRVPAPIFLYTDFGSADIYVGQVKAVLHAHSPATPVIDLLNDVPSFDVAAGAHLLAALAQRLPARAVTIAVVDPGVGSARGAVALEADGRWFVGPDNGLLSVVAARAAHVSCYALTALDNPPSASFHGRDFFAPHAAAIAMGATNGLVSRASLDIAFDSADLEQIIYVDHYGNAITGMRASAGRAGQTLVVTERRIQRARVFSDVAVGELFWYENSIGMIEIAANKAIAADLADLTVGTPVRVVVG